METVLLMFVSLFSFSTVILLSSQCETYAIKKGQELTDILLKDKQI